LQGRESGNGSKPAGHGEVVLQCESGTDCKFEAGLYTRRKATLTMSQPKRTPFGCARPEGKRCEYRRAR
jgi:hypothetical protein